MNFYRPPIDEPRPWFDDVYFALACATVMSGAYLLSMVCGGAH